MKLFDLSANNHQNIIQQFILHIEASWCVFALFQDDLTGQAILDVCFARLNLIETAYFGLRYLDEENQTVCYLYVNSSIIIVMLACS